MIKELSAAAPACRTATLIPLWEAAYLDLARPHLLPRLRAWRQAAERTPCRCTTPHD